jgi:hypothetical protein
MPICEADPWRLQYFAAVACPADTNIPTEDSDAWTWNPRHRWVYDKLAVAHTQGLQAAPHGVPPPRFPVFSKPIVNLKGMGIGSRVIRSPQEYDEHSASGHMWMTYLEGRHVSSDAAVVDGRPHWWRHVTGLAAGKGTFDYWRIHAAAEPAIEEACGRWIVRNLPGYTGMLNIETIGGTIIEVHLRFSDQWPDLYGTGWLDALVRLYSRGAWEFADTDRREAFSVVLFGPHGTRYRHPDAALVREIRAAPGVSSVQITFREDRRPEQHAMPLGGFRLAIVNCTDLATGFAARERLRAHFLEDAA